MATRQAGPVTISPVAVATAETAALPAVVVSLIGPAACALATVALPHGGALPSAGPSTGLEFPAGMNAFGRLIEGMLSGAVRPGPHLTTALNTDGGHYTWAAAIVGSNSAASYQLASRHPVLAIGGYNGTDPAPTLAWFETAVAQHRIHCFLDGVTAYDLTEVR